jgi:hypothetical protein
MHRLGSTKVHVYRASVSDLCMVMVPQQPVRHIYLYSTNHLGVQPSLPVNGLHLSQIYMGYYFPLITGKRHKIKAKNQVETVGCL